MTKLGDWLDRAMAWGLALWMRANTGQPVDADQDDDAPPAERWRARSSLGCEGFGATRYAAVTELWEGARLAHRFGLSTWRPWWRP